MLYERHKIASKSTTLMVHDFSFAYADFVVDNLVPPVLRPLDRGILSIVEQRSHRGPVVSASSKIDFIDIPTKLTYGESVFQMYILNFRYFYYCFFIANFISILYLYFCISFDSAPLLKICENLI